MRIEKRDLDDTPHSPSGGIGVRVLNYFLEG